MPRILFVTNELFPIARGGIGRLLYNYACWNAEQDRPADIHVLLLGVDAAKNWASSTLPPVSLHRAEELAEIQERERAFVERVQSGTYRDIFLRSELVAKGIAVLNDRYGLEFDYIEFPDFHGLAYSSIKAKLRGSAAFERAQIVVRLHSSMTMIQIDEGAYHRPSEWFAAITDIERYCLRFCDLVVGHLQAIVEANRQAFGFDRHWLQRTHVEFPPIFLTDEEKSQGVREKSPTTSENAEVFVFSSRFQPFKRPDLFIRAAVAYVRKNPHRADLFLLLSYGWDESYQAWLSSLVPEDLVDQIQIRTQYTSAERAGLLAEGIVVIPSTFESLCLFAYESYLFGRRVILNSRCDAFAYGQFWKNNENCLLFDGSVEDLSRAMEDAIRFVPNNDASLPESQPYWQRDGSRPEAWRNAGTFDVVVTDVQRGSGKSREAGYHGCNGARNTFVFQDHQFIHKSERTASETRGPLTILNSWGANIDPSMLRHAIDLSDSDYLLFVPEETVPSHAFTEQVHGALARSHADLIAFTTLRSDGCSLGSVLDCPNLVARGLEDRIPPVAIRSAAIKEVLTDMGCDQDWIVGKLVTFMVLEDRETHVLDLPLKAETAQEAHRYPLHHYISDTLAAIRRRKLPQLAAFVEVPYQVTGRPMVDEGAAMSALCLDVESNFSAQETGLQVDRIVLSHLYVTQKTWSVRVQLGDLSDPDGHDTGLSSVVAYQDGELTVRFLDDSEDTDLSRHPGGAEDKVLNSRAPSWPEGITPLTSEGRRRLRCVVLISESSLLWYGRTLAEFGLRPSPRIEQGIEIEANRLSALASQMLQMDLVAGRT